jgi:aminomethyltransferase
MTLLDLYRASGAEIAPDGIPVRFGDLKTEYHAGLKHAVLLDRSHEGRLVARGRDRLALLHRMSTNDLLNLGIGEGRVTLFTNPNARILDRATIFNQGDKALLLGEPGRGKALLAYLQSNVFFNDQVQFEDISNETRLFALHGPSADSVMETLISGASALSSIHGQEGAIAGTRAYVARRKPITGTHWMILAPVTHATEIWSYILESGKPHGLIPAGSLTYNVLRIRAGYPAFGRELSQEYIPLEVGLWDDVSFSKGCYTGQEIIARMESRNRLAKTITQLNLSSYVESPADLLRDSRRAGTLTSSVTSTDGEIFGIGVVKTQFAQVGEQFTIGENVAVATVTKLAGVQPATLLPEDIAET